MKLGCSSAVISSVARMTPMSHQAYGPLMGVPRILALLARHDLTATSFIPGYSAHRYPDVVRAIAAAGHEIAHHSYFHENTIGMDERTEQNTSSPSNPRPAADFTAMLAAELAR
jgi:peptidoglycan-N-acetylglucosamine deacetylase